MKLNAEQIKKALECCISGDDCTICPLCDEQSCPCVLNENALSLIKELTEKVEIYRPELGEVRVALAEANNDKKKLTEENKRLNASCTELTQCCTKLETLYKIESKRVDTAKADTVKKMQERLLKEFVYYNGQVFGAIGASTVDYVTKEMLKEN